MTIKTVRVRFILSTVALTLSLNGAAQAMSAGGSAFPPTEASDALSMPGGLFGWIATKAAQDNPTIVPIGK